jgi:hypothetical protein
MRVAALRAEATVADRHDSLRRDEKELPSVTGEEDDGTADDIGRDGDVLVQDDVVYGTGTERRGTPDGREREVEERKAP